MADAALKLLGEFLACQTHRQLSVSCISNNLQIETETALSSHSISSSSQKSLLTNLNNNNYAILIVSNHPTLGIHPGSYSSFLAPSTHQVPALSPQHNTTLEPELSELPSAVVATAGCGAGV